MNDLWQRLRQRKLVQWALAYVAAAFALLQGVDIVAQQFGWPETLQRGITLVMVLGFFVTLVLAWFHGERGLQKVSRLELLLLAVLLFGGGGLVWRYATSLEPAPESVTVVVPDAGKRAPGANPKSVAVLPFSDLSRGKDDDLIADGLSEEIINSLSRVPDLKVAARSSSFALRDSKLSAPDIAAKLHVASVLEGSVRRAGNRLRITARLIRAEDGFNLWSQDYDRTNADIILIQEDVAKSIAQALKTVTDPAALADMQRAGTRSVPAYDAYLKGLALNIQFARTGNEGDVARSLAAFDQAVLIAPDFAEARRQSIALAKSTIDVTTRESMAFQGITHTERLRAFRKRLDTATESTSDPAKRDYYRSLRAWVDLRFRDASQSMQQYVKRHPDDREALVSLSTLASYTHDRALGRRSLERLFLREGDPQAWAISMSGMLHLQATARALAMARAAVQRFPDDAAILYAAHRVLLAAGRVEEAAKLVPMLLAGESPESAKALVQMRQACAEGRPRDAERTFDRIRKTNPEASGLWHGLLLLGREDAAAKWLGKYDDPDDMYPLTSYLYYPKFDVRRFPRLVAVLEGQGIPVGPPVSEPYNCKQEVESP